MKAFTYNQHFVAMMNVINAARLNPPDKGHKHHIIPKCWYNMNDLPVDNSDDNLVKLSYEDHLKVHKLAYLCANGNRFRGKMAYAYHRLSKGDLVSNECFSGDKNAFFGKKHSEETRAKMSIHHADVSGSKNPFFGKTHSEDVLLRIVEANKGKPSWNKGKTGVYSEETLKKIGEASKGRIPKNKGKHKVIIDGRIRYV